MIKKIINFILEKFGYEIICISQKDKINFLYVKALEDVYRDYICKDYPEHDSERTNLLTRLLGTSPSEAIYILSYLRLSLQITGDVCEFGVAQGRTSALLAREIKDTDKRIWLFDSFQGLPKPSEKDILIDDIFNLGSMDQYEGKMSCGMQMVKSELKKVSFPLGRINIVPGFVEKTLHQEELPTQVCFAYIDMDFYEPILEALNYLDKVLQKNGFIVIDDYGFLSSGVKTAVKEFLETHNGKYEFLLPIKLAGHFCILKKCS